MIYEGKGYCPVCEKDVTFRSENGWYRDYLACTSCWSLVRERAVALILSEIAPNWRSLALHESSPSSGFFSSKLRREATIYVASQYFSGRPLGVTFDGWRNENLEEQTFKDASFDLVISLDVMEHVFEPAKAYAEIFRTLKPGGIYIHTFPINKAQVIATVRRARLRSDGSVENLAPPEWHRNPIDPEGSLVTMHYGYDIACQIAEWAPFDVRIIRFWDRHHGIMGDYTEVVICRKMSAHIVSAPPTT